jgi:succinate dehydrogenase / fumarate reductase cytochrome b subunit
VALSSSHGFLRSTIGKKYIMGLAGLIWAGFVLTHMAGNLLIFVGSDAYNMYSYALTSNKLLLVAEAILVLALVVHVWLALSLTMKNRAAGGAGRYAVKAKGEKRARFASTTMGVQGSVILAFVILHLATFKFGTHYETTVNGVVMRDLFRLMIEVFQSPGYVVWYLIALVLLAFHLSHGVGSVFQSFGWMNGRYQPVLRKLSIIYAVVVAAGFIAQPLYIFLFLNKG